MALGCLETITKTFSSEKNMHGEKLLSKIYKTIYLDELSIRLNQCIRLLKNNSDNLELTHEKTIFGCHRGQ